MPDDGEAELSAQVERDLKAYNSAFVQANRSNKPSLMRPWMRLPLLRFGIGSVHVASTIEELDALNQETIDGLKGSGYSQSILSDFDVSLMNPTTAFVRCHAVREKFDGEIIEAFEAAYVMARADGRWQIVCLIRRR